jgi:hypothetical protein
VMYVVKCNGIFFSFLAYESVFRECQQPFE